MDEFAEAIQDNILLDQVFKSQLSFSLNGQTQQVTNLNEVKLQMIQKLQITKQKNLEIDQQKGAGQVEQNTQEDQQPDIFQKLQDTLQQNQMNQQKQQEQIEIKPEQEDNQESNQEDSQKSAQEAQKGKIKNQKNKKQIVKEEKKSKISKQNNFKQSKKSKKTQNPNKKENSKIEDSKQSQQVHKKNQDSEKIDTQENENNNAKVEQQINFNVMNILIILQTIESTFEVTSTKLQKARMIQLQEHKIVIQNIHQWYETNKLAVSENISPQVENQIQKYAEQLQKFKSNSLQYQNANCCNIGRLQNSIQNVDLIKLKEILKQSQLLLQVQKVPEIPQSIQPEVKNEIPVDPQQVLVQQNPEKQKQEVIIKKQKKQKLATQNADNFEELSFDLKFQMEESQAIQLQD